MRFSRLFREPLLQKIDEAGPASGSTPPRSRSTGERLLSEIAGGDTLAFERFYDQHSSTIFGLLLKITSDASTAFAPGKPAPLAKMKAPGKSFRTGRP